MLDLKRPHLHKAANNFEVLFTLCVCRKYIHFEKISRKMIVAFSRLFSASIFEKSIWIGRTGYFGKNKTLAGYSNGCGVLNSKKENNFVCIHTLTQPCVYKLCVAHCNTFTLNGDLNFCVLAQNDDQPNFMCFCSKGNHNKSNKPTHYCQPTKFCPRTLF